MVWSSETTSVVDLIGGAGWGSFGLAGLVLAWLALRYLPAKDAQIKEFIEVMAQQRQHFMTLLASEREACLRERKELQEQFHQRNEDLGKRVDLLREGLLRLWELKGEPHGHGGAPFDPPREPGRG